MKTKTFALLAGLLATPALAETRSPPQEGRQLVLTGVGRFAVFGDRSTIERNGDEVRMRSFQAAEADFIISDQAYWGGWSWWSFDCNERTADRLDFVSVREGGGEGPATPDSEPPYPASPGGDAARLLATACNPDRTDEADAESMEEAVTVGRAALRRAG